MGHSKLNVSKKPIISIISTGDELIPPNPKPNFGQIICSNSYGIKALLEKNGVIAKILPIAKDNIASLETAFELAKNSDIVITTGGASVGDHDLVQQVAKNIGIKSAFYKVAMRPGKPLMAGRCNSFTFVGLPGNPVSSMICSEVFLKPMINKMLGLNYEKTERTKYPLTNALKKNGSREHYMRAQLKDGKVTVQINQDSASTSILQSSNALVVRPPHDQCREKNDLVDVIRL
jgi:molybdopterin molybdotransferase